MSFSHRWRDIGLMVAYIGFNIFAIFACTYLVSVQLGGDFRLLSLFS